ncbi:MAG TPA: outer membrane beta-barrel domain-containing protein, partial [Syntrophorhabdaceae bacterium]|nr:outer membrane beta-barrel domain-containing protein [Syntrophorhabdaceae bacterium]
MKRFYVFLFLILFLALSATAYAQIRPGAIAITPIFGGYTFEGNQDLKTSPLYGLRAGFDFTKNIGAELYYSYVQGELRSNDRRTNVHNYRLEGLYHFLPDKKFVPFAAVGLGGTTLNYPGNEGRKTRGVFDYGLGLKYFILKQLALRGDVRHVLTTGSVYNNLEYTFGLTFYFGGKEPVVA